MKMTKRILILIMLAAMMVLLIAAPAAADKIVSVQVMAGSSPISNGYAPLIGSGTNSGLYENTLVTTAGSFSKLSVVMDFAPGVGMSYVIKLVKNGVATSLTVTIAGTDTDAKDITNSVSVVAGDTVTLSTQAIGGAAVNRIASWTTNFTATIPNASLLGNTHIYIGGGSPLYVGLGYYNGSATEANVATLISANGYIKNLAVEMVTPPGAGVGGTFTLYLNGAPTALTTNVSGAVDHYSIDTTHTVAVAAGDTISVEYVVIGAPAFSVGYWGMTFIATNLGDSIVTAPYDTSSATTLPGTYSVFPVSPGSGLVQVNETILHNLYVSTDAAPGPGNTWTWTVWKNGVITALTVTIGNPSTSGSDTVNTVSFVDGDVVDIRETEVGVPAGTGFRISTAECNLLTVIVPIPTVPSTGIGTLPTDPGGMYAEAPNYLWLPAAFGAAIVLGFVAFHFTRQILVQAIVSGVVLAFFWQPGMATHLIPGWTLYVFVVEALAIVILRERFVVT